jgi:hypothetical protein
MPRFHEGFCLHKHRTWAVGAFVFFLYLFVRQTIRLVRPSHLAALVHPNFNMSVAAILAGMVCAIGIFLEVKCIPERIVLGMVVVDSLGALVALLLKSSSVVTEYRALSTVIRLLCALITGGLAFRSRVWQRPGDKPNAP